MSVIRNNSSDLRVQKSVKVIKAAFLTLIMKKPYKKIRVDEITKEAMINRQTFYSHFSSIDNVLEAVGEDMLQEMRNDLKPLEPADLRGGVAVFYTYLNADDPVKQKLFFDKEFTMFFRDFSEKYFSLDFFSSFCGDNEYSDLVPSFIANAASGIFKRWRQMPPDRRVGIDQLAGDTADLLMNGLNKI